MIVALASPSVAATLDEGLDKVKWLMSDAASLGAEIVCFPEAYLPGLRGHDFEVPPFDQAQEARVVKTVAESGISDQEPAGPFRRSVLRARKRPSAFRH